MVKRLKEKMNTLLEARKNNKGFTLVELIVVIVILAILVGVTIGGIYGYVNKSRINTDINNASAITSTLQVVTTVKDAKVAAAVTRKDITGKTGADVATAIGLSGTAATRVAELLPDGVPSCKTADAKFCVTTTITKDTGDTTGVITSIKVEVGTCTADTDGNVTNFKALTGQE